MTASPTFAERILILHEALDRAGVGHGFGGAVALAYYVEEPRATRDIDINIAVPTENSGLVLGAMPAGVEVPRASGRVVERDGQIRLWWDGRSGIPVDLFFPQHPFHDQVARDTRKVPFLGTEIPIISATHLTVFKCLFNRARDWPDISAMLGAGTVDVAAALDWLGRLLGPGSGPFEHLALVAREAASVGGDEPPADTEPPVVDWGKLGA